MKTSYINFEYFTGSGDSRPDSGASSPRSPGPVGASSNGNRPQARVLPSTRSTESTDSGRGGPRRKVRILRGKFILNL